MRRRRKLTDEFINLALCESIRLKHRRLKREKRENKKQEREELARIYGARMFCNVSRCWESPPESINVQPALCAMFGRGNRVRTCNIGYKPIYQKRTVCGGSVR